MGWQSTTCAVASRPSLLWKCTTEPASSLAGERRAQPCALTTMVSHISEKCVSGLRAVTRTGRAIGTRELRREVSGASAECIEIPFEEVQSYVTATLVNSSHSGGKLKNVRVDTGRE